MHKKSTHKSHTARQSRLKLQSSSTKDHKIPSTLPTPPTTTLSITHNTRHSSSSSRSNSQSSSSPSFNKNAANIYNKVRRQGNFIDDLIKSRHRDGSLKATHPIPPSINHTTNQPLYPSHSTPTTQSFGYTLPNNIDYNDNNHAQNNADYLHNNSTPTTQPPSLQPKHSQTSSSTDPFTKMTPDGPVNVRYRYHPSSDPINNLPLTKQATTRRELRLQDPDRLYPLSTIQSVYPDVDWFDGFSLDPTIPFPLNHKQTTDIYLHQTLPQFTPRVGSEQHSDIQLAHLARQYVQQNGGQISSAVAIGQTNEIIAKNQSKSSLLPDSHPFNNLSNTSVRFQPVGKARSQSWGMIATQDIPKGTTLVKIPSQLSIRDGTPLLILDPHLMPHHDKVWLNDLMIVMTLAKIAISKIDTNLDVADTLSFGLHLALLRIIGDKTQYNPIIQAMPAEFPTLDMMLSKDSVFRSYHSDKTCSLDFFEQYCQFIIRVPIQVILHDEEHKWVIESRPDLLQYFDEQLTVFDALYTLTKHKMNFTTEQDLFHLLKWGLFTAQTRTVDDALPHPELTGHGNELSINPYRSLIPMLEYFNHNDDANCEHLIEYYPPLDINEASYNISHLANPKNPNNYVNQVKASPEPMSPSLEPIVGLNYRPIFNKQVQTDAKPGIVPANSNRQIEPIYNPKLKGMGNDNTQGQNDDDDDDYNGDDADDDGDDISNTKFKGKQFKKTNTPFDLPKQRPRSKAINYYENNTDNYKHSYEIVKSTRDIKAGEELTVSYYPTFNLELGDIGDFQAQHYRETFQGNLTVSLQDAFHYSIWRHTGVRGESRKGIFADVENGLVIPFQHGFVPKFNPNHSIPLNKFSPPMILEYTPSYFYLSRKLSRSYIPGQVKIDGRKLSRDEDKLAHVKRGLRLDRKYVQKLPSEFDDLNSDEREILRSSPHAHWTRQDAPFQFMLPAPYPSLDFNTGELISECPRYAEVLDMLKHALSVNPRTQQVEPIHSFFSLSWRGPTPHLEAISRLYGAPGFFAHDLGQNSTLSFEQSGEHTIKQFKRRVNKVLDIVESRVRDEFKIHKRQELSPNDWFTGFSTKIDDENEAVKNFIIYLQLQDFLIRNPFPLRHIHRGYLNSLYSKDYDSAMFGLDLYHDTSLAVHASRILETILGFDTITSPNFITPPWIPIVMPHENTSRLDPISPETSSLIDVERLLHRTALPYYDHRKDSKLNQHTNELFKKFYLGGTDIAEIVTDMVQHGVIEPPKLIDNPEALTPQQSQQIWAEEVAHSIHMSSGNVGNDPYTTINHSHLFNPTPKDKNKPSPHPIHKPNPDLSPAQIRTLQSVKTLPINKAANVDFTNMDNFNKMNKQNTANINDKSIPVSSKLTPSLESQRQYELGKIKQLKETRRVAGEEDYDALYNQYQTNINQNIQKQVGVGKNYSNNGNAQISPGTIAPKLGSYSNNNNNNNNNDQLTPQQLKKQLQSQSINKQRSDYLNSNYQYQIDRYNKPDIGHYRTAAGDVLEQDQLHHSDDHNYARDIDPKTGRSARDALQSAFSSQKSRNTPSNVGFGAKHNNNTHKSGIGSQYKAKPIPQQPGVWSGTKYEVNNHNTKPAKPGRHEERLFKWDNNLRNSSQLHNLEMENDAFTQQRGYLGYDRDYEAEAIDEENARIKSLNDKSKINYKYTKMATAESAAAAARDQDLAHGDHNQPRDDSDMANYEQNRDKNSYFSKAKEFKNKLAKMYEREFDTSNLDNDGTRIDSDAPSPYDIDGNYNPHYSYGRKLSQDELYDLDYEWQRKAHERERIQNLQDMHMITSVHDPYDKHGPYGGGAGGISRDAMLARGSMRPYDVGDDPEFEKWGAYGPLGPNYNSGGNYESDMDDDGPYKLK